MKKTILILIIFFISKVSFSQTTKEDSIKKVQIEASKFIDSISKKTTLADFNKWLYENVTQQSKDEGKWSELYNLFLRTEYQKWLVNPKKKP